MVGDPLVLLRALAATWWWSVGLGGGIGALYVASGVLTGRYAMRQATGRFLLIVLGGMLARMVVALLLVVLILALAPVEQAAFVGAFFGVFVLGLGLEVAGLHRVGRRSRNA